MTTDSELRLKSAIEQAGSAAYKIGEAGTAVRQAAERIADTFKSIAASADRIAGAVERHLQRASEAVR